jgi:hypothetical protein
LYGLNWQFQVTPYSSAILSVLDDAAPTAPPTAVLARLAASTMPGTIVRPTHFILVTEPPF